MEDICPLAIEPASLPAPLSACRCNPTAPQHPRLLFGDAGAEELFYQLLGCTFHPHRAGPLSSERKQSHLECPLFLNQLI